MKRIASTIVTTGSLKDISADAYAVADFIAVIENGSSGSPRKVGVMKNRSGKSGVVMTAEEFLLEIAKYSVV